MKKIAKYILVLVALVFFGFSFKLGEAARLAIIGFEGGTNECNLVNGTLSLSSAIFNSGTSSLRTNPVGTNTGTCRIGGYSANGLVATFTSTATAYHKFNFYPASLPTSTEIFVQVQNGSQVAKATGYLTPAGLINFRDNTGTSLGTSTITLSTGTWYRIEMTVGTGVSATFELKVNGTQEISGTGNLTASNNAYLSVGKRSNTNGANVDFYYDDVSIDDTAYPGDTHILSLSPNATGTTQQWTKGVGNSNWSSIDEKINNSADYVMTDTSLGPDTISQHELQNTSVPGISGTVNGLVLISIMRESLSGTTNAQIGIWSNGVIASTTGAGAGLGTANATLGKYQNTDPNTGSAWTTAGIDAVQAGFVDNGSSTVAIRGFWMSMDVDYTSSTGPVYQNSGTYTSGVLDATAGVSAWGALSWDQGGTGSITIKARSSSDAFMGGAPAWGSCSAIANGEALFTGGCVTIGDRYIQYQAVLTTADTSVTPSLDSITLGYVLTSASSRIITHINKSFTSSSNVDYGTIAGSIQILGPPPKSDLTSSIFDTQMASGTALNYILWQGDLPSSAIVQFQIASSNCSNGATNPPVCSTGAWSYVGPDGSNATYYNPTGPDIALPINLKYHNNYRYFRYLVDLQSGLANSPRVDDIIIGWSP